MKHSDRPTDLIRRRLLNLGLLIGAAGFAPAAMAESIRSRFSLTRRTFPMEPDPADSEKMIARAIRGREPVEGLVTMELAGLAENGDSVPMTFDVHCSMQGNDYPEVVHVFVVHNPFPEVARYHFGPWNGSARTEMRVRMRQTSDMVVVAEMADGKVGIARKSVEVLAGACG